MKVVVAGAGGMIGGHLVKRLLQDGHSVRAVDIKSPRDWWQIHRGLKAQNWGSRDLSKLNNALDAVNGSDYVFDLAENMGGIGYITENRVDCAESIEIGINLLRASERCGVKRFFFSSSACVYNTALQQSGMYSLKEDDAWPAQPEDGYGFAKLYMEELCRHYSEERGVETRVARYHNVYGPPCSWNDGKEKSPAALCRKVAEAEDTSEIEIWGDGSQIRSYLHVDDCVEGTLALMDSDMNTPINIGSDRAVTIFELATMIEYIAGKDLDHRYNMQGAQGVVGRNADITMAKATLDWEPKVSLEDGLTQLYAWIKEQVLSGPSNDRTAPRATTTA